jgi:aminotransferase
LLFPILEKIGLQPVLPQGAYYIWTDSKAIAPNANLAAHILAKEYGVAAVPGNCFCDPRRPADTVHSLRFCFAKKDSTLAEAVHRLERLL